MAEITAKPTMKAWIENYETNKFDNFADLKNNKNCNWFYWQDENNLPKYMQGLYEAIKALYSTEKLSAEDFYVTLKEVETFSAKSILYANVIISQEKNNLPVVILTPDYSGNNTNNVLFVIQNKNRIEGSLEDMIDYINNNKL